MFISRRFLVALVFACVLAVGGCDSSHSTTGYPPPAFPADAIYVCNQGAATVSVIDPQTNALAGTVDLRDVGLPGNTAPADAQPHDVAVEPDGSAFYVSLIGFNLVAKFDQRGELVGTSPFASPGMLAVDPAKDLLYATHAMGVVDVPSTVAAIQRSDMSVVEVVNVAIGHPHAVGVHPGGGYAYTGSLLENRLATIDTRTQAVSTVSQGGQDVQRYVQFSLSPDGTRLYLTAQDAGALRIFDVSDPAAPQLLQTVGVNAAPWHPSLSDDGRRLYFGNKAVNTVTVFNTATQDTTVIQGEGKLAQPHGSALSPDGKYLYVSNQNGTYGGEGNPGTVAVISTAGNEIVKVIDVDEKPAGVGARAGS